MNRDLTRKGSSVLSVRLGNQTLAQLDAFAARVRAKTGMTTTRSDALRWLLSEALKRQNEIAEKLR